MNRRNDPNDHPMDDGRGGYPDGTGRGHGERPLRDDRGEYADGTGRGHGERPLHDDRGAYRDDRGAYDAAQVRQKGGAGMGIAALLLGLLALVLFWIPVLGIVLGVIAIIVGLVARGRAKRINGSGRGMGLAGAILGLLAAILCGLVMFGIFTLFQSSSYDECLRDAGTDQAALEQCAQDFADELRDRVGGTGATVGVDQN